jgi:hypothetical protein
MNATALLRLDETDVEVSLVYPEDADLGAMKLSIFLSHRHSDSRIQGGEHRRVGSAGRDFKNTRQEDPVSAGSRGRLSSLNFFRRLCRVDVPYVSRMHN